MKVYLVIIALLIGNEAFSQTPFFGHMARPKQAASGLRSRAITITPAGDSIFTGFRPTATAAYGYSNNGGSTILAFAGFGYEHDTYKSNSGNWYTDYAISLQIGTGASNGSVSLANATTLGLFGSFLNHLITIGVGYNFSNKVAMPLVGPGIAFH
jgi:hypothetical protein